MQDCQSVTVADYIFHVFCERVLKFGNQISFILDLKWVPFLKPQGTLGLMWPSTNLLGFVEAKVGPVLLPRLLLPTSHDTLGLLWPILTSKGTL